ncbi:hypothetical protein BDR04DRAFT_1035994 [Suillus decipiens]|nr:hypothetical protein BDR04DRAFT_1035994 [Suillus decipiens]
MEFIDAVHALHNEVKISCVLNARPKLSHAPQLHLLPEWRMHAPDKFCQKLHVCPAVFNKLIECIQPHAIFYNNSNNSQLPIPIQLAVFLNSIGHYGNAATMQDLAEYAGVSIITVYNCFKRVMIALLKYHDDAIHFNPLDQEDQEEWKRAQQWVEEKTCWEWCGSFVCINGTLFNLFWKPGWHSEGFCDKNSNYSLTAQVVILPHNLCIVDYVIGIPGSLHDSNVFGQTRVTRTPNNFFGMNQWLWANSAYALQVWCVMPFK